jgi:hypothetical protein
LISESAIVCASRVKVKLDTASGEAIASFRSEYGVTFVPGPGGFPAWEETMVIDYIKDLTENVLAALHRERITELTAGMELPVFELPLPSQQPEEA